MRLYPLVRTVAFALLWSSFSSITLIPMKASAQSAPGGMCLDVFADGTGFQNTCPYNVSTAWCIINPDFPNTQEGPYYYGQGNCGKEEYTGTLIKASKSMRVDPKSLFFGEGVVWLECRWSDGSMTYSSKVSGTGQLRLKPRPHFEATCMRGGKIVPGFTAMRQLSANSRPEAVEGQVDIRPRSEPGPIMEEAWNGVNTPPKPPAPAKNAGAKRTAKDKPVPHLSDDQKVLNEVLRLTTPPKTKTEADARYEAELREYEQKLTAQQKAVADFEAAQRQMEADKAAAAAKARAAQEDFARQQAAYQVEQDRYAREQAQYQAQLTGQPGPVSGSNGNNQSASGPGGGTTVPPLRPTVTLEDHNPANEASRCLDLIVNRDFEARGVSSVMGAVFRNSCPFPVETRWCIGANRCATGYDNLATMPATNDRGISYDEPAPGTTTETRWAGCRLGFVYRPDFAGTLDYACK